MSSQGYSRIVMGRRRFKAGLHLAAEQDSCTVDNSRPLWDLNDFWSYLYGEDPMGGFSEQLAQTLILPDGCELAQLNLRVANYNGTVPSDAYYVDAWHGTDPPSVTGSLSRSSDVDATTVPDEYAFSHGEALDSQVPFTTFTFPSPLVGTGGAVTLILRRYAVSDVSRPGFRGAIDYYASGSEWIRNSGSWVEDSAGGNTFDLEFVVNP